MCKPHGRNDLNRYLQDQLTSLTPPIDTSFPTARDYTGGHNFGLRRSRFYVSTIRIFLHVLACARASGPCATYDHFHPRNCARSFGRGDSERDGFRLEAINFLNHPFFSDLGSSTVTGNTFGQVTSTSGTRSALLRGYVKLVAPQPNNSGVDCVYCCLADSPTGLRGGIPAHELSRRRSRISRWCGREP